MKKGLTLFFTVILFSIAVGINSQWVELNSGIANRLNSLSSIKDVTTWACGAGGTVIKSSNMGDSWSNGNLSGIPVTSNLNHVYCLNENIVISLGNDQNTTYLYRTADGGITWAVKQQQPAGKFNALHFIDMQTGILVGDPVGGRWSIWKTIDGGLNWDSTGCYLPQVGNEKGFANALWAMGNNIWFGTDNFRVYRSVNFASSWFVQSTGSEKNSASLWFDFDFNIGLSGNGSLIRTYNGGGTWNSETLPGSGNVVGTTGSAHSRFNWALRSDNNIYLNPHNSTNWVYDYAAPNGNYTYITIERNGYFSGAVFALRDNGGISRTFFLSLGINTISSNIPTDFKLYQNYPNPFNPVTKFRFDIKSSGAVELSIYDNTGKKVEKLLSANMTPGTYEIDWNASKYSSGIYYYRIEAGSFSATNKMVLVK